MSLNTGWWETTGGDDFCLHSLEHLVSYCVAQQTRHLVWYSRALLNLSVIPGSLQWELTDLKGETVLPFPVCACPWPVIPSCSFQGTFSALRNVYCNFCVWAWTINVWFLKNHPTSSHLKLLSGTWQYASLIASCLAAALLYLVWDAGRGVGERGRWDGMTEDPITNSWHLIEYLSAQSLIGLYARALSGKCSVLLCDHMAKLASWLQSSAADQRIISQQVIYLM